MKNLKDYFSSPKSSDVSLNDSAKLDFPSEDDRQQTSKRKKRKSLSNGNSKRKKTSTDNVAGSKSWTDSRVPDDSTLDCDVFTPKRRSNAKRRSSSEPVKSLSLKKTKSSAVCENDANSVNSTSEESSTKQVNDLVHDASSSKIIFFEKSSKILDSSLHESKEKDSSLVGNNSAADKDYTFIEFSKRSVVEKFIIVDDDVEQRLVPKIVNDVKPTENNDDTRVDTLENEVSPNLIDGKSVGGNTEVVKRKKRLKKSKAELNDVQDDDRSESIGKKRKKSVEKLSPNDSAEDADPFLPVNRRSLLNYFNKVDKVASLVKSCAKQIIKVEAIVHEPRFVKNSECKSIVKKKVKRCKNPDFDLITMDGEGCNVEEPTYETVTPVKSAWKMRISLQSPRHNCDSVFEDCNSFGENSFSLSEDNPTPDDAMADDRLMPTEGDSSCAAMNSRITKPASSNISAEVIELDESTDGEQGTSENYEKEAVVIIADNELKEDPKHSSRLSKPTLKGAGTLTAYFGSKFNAKKVSMKQDQCDKIENKKVEERSVATQMFLESPAPPALKKILINSSDSIKGTPAPFPVRSHIRQKDRLNIMWNLSPHNLCLKSTDADTTPAIPKFSKLCQINYENKRKAHFFSSTATELKTAIKHLKEQETELPIKKWMECLRYMKRNSSVSQLWNEKYRPKTTEDVIIERTNVQRLSEWLNSFQSNNSSNDNDSESSSDEFINDKDEKVNKCGNTALLLGPPGVGKTAAVFAAAKQNGYQVLELNASCNRNGKKVLHEFSEATQSHKVETKTLFKSKSKKKDKNKQNNKKSLILIEDSDLIFDDQDEGYIGCLSLLQSGSKRPLVLVANNPNCKHLMKLASSKSTLFLSFQRPKPHILSSYLKSLSLVEGDAMSSESCQLLLETAKCDVRKAVATLQFFGPLFKQLDRRKLRLQEDRSCLVNSSWNTRKDAVKNLNIANSNTIVDLLSPLEQEWTHFCCFRESTSVKAREEEEPVDIFKEDLCDFLINQIPSDHYPYEAASASSCQALDELMDGSVRLSRRSVSCDYLGSLRQIARAERARLAQQTKRNKRYFNHLNNLGINTSDRQLIDAICSTLATEEITTGITTVSQFEDIPVI